MIYFSQNYKNVDEYIFSRKNNKNYEIVGFKSRVLEKIQNFVLNLIEIDKHFILCILL